MSMHLPELTGELTALGSEFRELGQQLSEAGRRLEQSGQPPEEALMARVQQACRRFVEIRDAARQLAVSERVPSVADADELTALADLEKLLKSIADACAERERRDKQQQLLQAGRHVLDRILSITHKDGIDFTPLRECQDKARALREASEANPDRLPVAEYVDLVEGRHSLCDLLTLVESRDAVDDVRWVELEEGIARAYGKPLSVAATRGKLIVSSPSARPESAAANPVEHAAEAAPALSSPPVKEERAEEEDTEASTITLLAREDTQADGHANDRPRDDRTEMDLALPAASRAPLSEQDSASLRRAWPDDQWRRSPLTAEQEAELLAPNSGVAILFGSHIAGLDDVERFLEAACQDTRLIILDAATDRSSFLRELDGLVQDRPDGVLLVVVPAQCPWSEDWVLRTLELMKRKPNPRKITRVLFIAGPEAAWSWVRTDEELHNKMLKDGLRELSLKPWSRAALQSWLADAGLAESDPFIGDRFARATGNWGELLHQVGRRCQNDPDDWQEHLADFERQLTNEMEWEDRLGLVAQAHTVLKTMAQLTQPVSVETIAARTEGISEERVETVMRWADLLSYVRRPDHYQWALDPVVRQVVLQANPQAR